jgi:hypothetical protein
MRGCLASVALKQNRQSNGSSGVINMLPAGSAKKKVLAFSVAAHKAGLKLVAW